MRGLCPRAVVGPLRSPRDRSSVLALPHEFPVDSFVDRQYHYVLSDCKDCAGREHCSSDREGRGAEVAVGDDCERSVGTVF